jgi:hypothetical protein
MADFVIAAPPLLKKREKKIDSAGQWGDKSHRPQGGITDHLPTTTGFICISAFLRYS